MVVTQPVGGFLITSTSNSYNNAYTNSIGYENLGQPYLGKSSTNVITSSVTYDNSNNSTTTTNYTYTYDASGRVATQITTGGSTSTQTYTYY